jgi:hypothetical protein
MGLHGLLQGQLYLFHAIVRTFYNLLNYTQPETEHRSQVCSTHASCLGGPEIPPRFGD